MSNTDASVPWGRPAVDSIPLPPFGTAEERTRFTRALQLHVALVDDGAPSLAAKVLAEALGSGRRGPGGGGPDLTPLELTVALATYFPAPWTPAALAAVLADRHGAPRDLGDGSWNWGYDPDFTAVPREGGGWEVERHERGSRRPFATLERDGDLVLMWMDHVRTSFAYPYGWRAEAAVADALAEPVRAVRRAHAADAGRPYLVNWRAERERFLDEGRA
ncbi:hypothetical protein [Glycomyces artemisiae]|uniref:Uncharacterized protein n=1 Tax=Glycomyces artemisiae TaxID=1076443 RepID=A0A2T0UA66_9ACTN|nr:hypothetical protein [Glycomyces artemisiae]PRY54772.1 hypothetical protein B0I28_11444 [Glycomyces artemisiae]